MERRDFFRVAAAGSVLMGAGGFPWPESPLEIAQAAGAWIRAQGRETAHGLIWPVIPSQSHAETLHLYSGTPGIILFLLELYHATGDETYLLEAESGAMHLASVGEGALGSPLLPGWGLYTGLAGVVYTLCEVYRVGGHAGVGEGAQRLIRRLMEDAKPLGEGVAWYMGLSEEAAYDIIGGSAGIGLTLLYLYESRQEEGALELAIRAGRLLAERGRPAHNGLKWPMSEVSPRLMPNFSHGTAGVAYFLGRLFEVTGDEAFLAPAVYGARYLENIFLCDAEGGCWVFHHEPGGERLVYLGWCHGPVGTARLFRQLHTLTGEGEWQRRVEQGARGIRHEGVPEERVEGFWNNVSQCCGDAGAGDFFLSLHAAGIDRDGLRYARRFRDYLLSQTAWEGERVRWIQAENRTQPENVVAQTGWMQGAAGVGAFFLHLDGAERGRKARVVFPDSPWRGYL